jgi:ankyrin repeat protein
LTGLSKSQYDKQIEILGRLHEIDYEGRKNLNPERFPETCNWFQKHERFQEWEKSRESRMLWVSADPGCGKSVLAKYLVDSVLPTTQSRTVCYFFFKDIDDQRSVVRALCCVLRQIFIQNRNLLSGEILDLFETGGEIFTTSFSGLWQILLDIAKNENAGEIVCVLDAIDECEEQGRMELVGALCRLYGTKSDFNLKFLLTSRPYDKIRQGFWSLQEQGLPFHLSGDDSVEKISGEICLVIRGRVQEISAKRKLTVDEKNLLLERLLRVPNRTYLWVHLTLDLIEKDISINTNEIDKATSCLPQTVDDAYETILSRSPDVKKAERILHIVVAAARPLTLREMSLALVLRQNHRSYDDFQKNLVSEIRVRETVRETCGLFVTIIDSNIHLLHQTVKEFLVPDDRVDSLKGASGDRKWKHSLRPQESHHILAKSCIQYLLLAEFETFPLDENGPLSQYVNDHIFLDYSAKHWAAHLRESHVDTQDAFTEPALRLCEMSSKRCLKRCLTWFRIYWTSTNTDFPQGFTTGMIVSYFGLSAVVAHLLKADRIDPNAEDITYQRSALSWAAGNGYDDVVRLLIKHNAISTRILDLRFSRRTNFNSVDKYGRTPLTYAVWGGNLAVVKLLLQAGAKADLEDKSGGTPLDYAFCNGRKDMLESLIMKGFRFPSEKGIREKLLLSAAGMGDTALVELLLKSDGVNIETRDTIQRTPLLCAVQKDQTAVVKVLLEKAEINVQGSMWETPLHWVAMNGNKAIMLHLLSNGADIDARDKNNGTPLAWAIELNMTTCVETLLEKGSKAEYWYHLVSLTKH